MRETTMRGVALLSSLVTLSSASPARANDSYLAAEGVEARAVTQGLPTAVNDGLWAATKATAVPVFAQRTVRLPDARANAHLDARAPREVMVRAVYNDRELGVLLEWSDPSEDRAQPDATDTFGDAAALELPQRLGAVVRLPYVGMGDEEQRVYLFMQRAALEGVGAQAKKTTRGGEYVAAGFGSATRVQLGWMKMAMDWDPGKRTWRALFVRPLTAGPSELRQGLLPFAVAVWDGAKGQRGGNKLLSSWRVLRLSKFPLSTAYLKNLSWGYGEGERGDPARGKALVDALCTTCHHIGDQRMAPPGVAPELTNIGGISTFAYLRDSMIDPSALIVPNLNFNQHYNKSGPPDASGALPNNDQYRWYTVDAATRRKASKMPSFAKMPPRQLADVVAYLKTLAPVGEANPPQ